MNLQKGPSSSPHLSLGLSTQARGPATRGPYCDLPCSGSFRCPLRSAKVRRGPPSSGTLLHPRLDKEAAHRLAPRFWLETLLPFRRLPKPLSFAVRERAVVYTIPAKF